MAKYIFFLILLLSLNICVAQDYSDPVTRLYAKIRIDSLKNEVSILYNNKLFENILQVHNQLLEESVKVFGKKAYETYDVLNNQAYLYYCFWRLQEAIQLENEVVEIGKEIFGIFHQKYANSLYNLAHYYCLAGDYKNAIIFGTEATEILKNILGNKHLDYASCLNNLAGYYSELGNYQEAIRIGTEALEIRKEILGSLHHDYGSSLSNIASYQSELGNLQEAINMGEEAVKILKNAVGEHNPDYANSLSHLAAYYANLGDYQEALRLESDALRIRKEVFGVFHPDYAASLNGMSSHYSKLGNYREAIKLGTKTLEIYKNIIGDNHPTYASTLCNLATYHWALGNYEEAFRLGTEAMEIQKEVLGDKHPAYAMSLSNVASYHSALGNYEEAVKLDVEGMEIRKELLGTYSPDYAASLHNLAYDYMLIGDINKSIQLSCEAVEILKEILGEYHADYITAGMNLACFYFWLRNYDNMKSMVVQLYPKLEKTVKSTFLYLPIEERQLFWAKFKKPFEVINTFVDSNPDKNLTEYGYNSTLFSKGILLNSEHEFTLFLDENDSKDLKDKYNEIVNLRLQLNKLYDKPISERHCDTDSLESLSNELERKLMEDSKEFGDYTRNLAMKWEEVRDRLKEKDVAIEFVTFPLTNDSTMYAAYLLKRYFEAPVMVRLFEEKEMDMLKDDELYSKTNGSDLLWSKLRNELDGVENIYFAPDGILHQIGIEYFPDFENPGRQLSDRFNLYRLSSTRQLALKRPETGKEGVIYGGIKYDSDPESMMNESNKYGNSESRGFQLWNSITDDISTRARFNYLPYTLTEASLIKEMFDDSNQNPLLITGIEATEESLRNLSGKKKNILHIATHGFYWEEDEADRAAKNNERLMFMTQFGENSRRNVEDKALSRTGLLMAGAQNVLTGKEIPEGVDDGILTAQEIANLDLRDLDLAVLSACQTAMGEVSSEGVFGLQRGFKKAGANSILMSLWKVDDEATQILMTEFYRNYLSGKSKHHSLMLAQKKLREDPQFEDPEFWAAFILLDGLN